VLPLLQRYSVRAEFFVSTAMIGQPDYLSWGELLGLQEGGMSIQSHSHAHVDLSRLSPLLLCAQLVRSKNLLEDHLNRFVTALAVPYGLLNRRVLEMAWHVGYKTVCTSWCWPARWGHRVVGRTAIGAHTSTRDVLCILHKNPLWYLAQRTRSACLAGPKRILVGLWPNRFGVQVLSEKL